MRLASSQLRPISTSRVLRSDALFVHRDKDPDVKHFEFNNENIKVIKSSPSFSKLDEFEFI